jgi:hypothetical protein
MSVLVYSDDKEVVLGPEYENYSLAFIYGLSGWETAKGWRCYVYLTNNKQEYWPLFFYDPVRLTQDIETDGYIAELGMIVINEVTLDNMIKTVKKLLGAEFFNQQKVYTRDEIKTIFPQ